LISNESTFEYSFSEELLDKSYEIALVKLNGILETNNKIKTINKFDENNNAFSGGKLTIINKHVFEYNSKAIDNIFVWCNLINDSYVNDRKLNSIYRFKFVEDEIIEEPHQIIYHKVTSRPNKIILRLVDSNNNLIEFDSVNLFIELNMKELKI
jgi:hypothetical protein